MKKRSERSVRELYDRTETIDEPEDDSTAHQKNMFCGDMRAETGTCNVCAAPCSSCMHRIAMESNVDCESSDNICHRKEADICSFVDSKSRTSPDLKHAHSEASNFLTASSSHDTLSDNAESKATFPATKTFEKTEAVGMSLNAVVIEKLGQAPVCHTNTTLTGKVSCNNSTPFVHQTALQKHESDCHGESESCISGVRDTGMQKSDQIADVEMNDVSCNSALKCNIIVNESMKVNEICSSVVTSQDKANNLGKCVVADPRDSRTSNPKYEASVECKMVSDPPSRLFEEEDPCSNKVAGRDGCDEAIRKASTNEQPETHIPVNGESHLLDCDTEAHAVAENQACESEVLFDVNVCDICGDAGKEDHLATCSRCLDGAEHIYCMRNMLDKLPEGDWLCEECQIKEESEKKRLSKLGAISRLSKAHQMGEKIQNSGISVHRMNLPKTDMKSTDLEISRPSESMKSSKKLDNKHMSHKDVISLTCKNVSQSRHVSTSPRTGVCSFPETSYKNSNLVKGKPSEIASSSRRLPAYNFQSSSRSNTLSPNLLKSERELHAPRKILRKQLSSSSLGVMPKPKQLLKASSEVISRESASKDIRKEGTIGTLRKSSSFKGASSGNGSFGLVSKSQMLKSPRTEESRGFKSMKEWNTMEKKKFFVLERPAEKSLPNFVKPIPEVDVKVSSNAANSNNKSEVNILSTRKIPDGNKEMRTARQLKSHNITDAENKESGDAFKGVVRSNPGVASNTLKNVGPFLMPQVADNPNYTFQGDKGIDSVLSGSRQVITGKNVPLHYHRLEDLNGSTDLCHDDKINFTSVKPSVNVNLKKRNRWKDAVEAAIDEKIHKRTKYFEPSEEQKESNNTVIAEIPPKSSLSSKIRGKSLLSEARSDGDESLRNIGVGSGKREGPKAEQLEFDLNIALPVPDDLKTELSFQSMPDCASLLSSSLGASSFPKHDFIWRGDFEISRTEQHSEVVNGIQAHLSFSASPKVPHVAERFPCKIELVEVPRVRSWPLQFQETSPTEENIALYFFAKDFESYEKSYQRLLDDMHKSDLALIGSINEVELLIFHSNTLPEASQRWNTLFFLWGVFRGRKSNSTSGHSNLQEQSNGFELTKDTLVQESVSSFLKTNSSNFPKEKMAWSGNSVKMEGSNDSLKIEESPIEKTFGDASVTGSCRQSDIVSQSYHMNCLPGSLGSFQNPMKASLNSIVLNGGRHCAGMTRNGTFLGYSDNVEAKKRFHVQAHVEENTDKPFSALFIASESIQGDKLIVSLEETTRKISMENEAEQVTPAIMGTGNVSWKLNKRYLDLSTTPLWREISTGNLKSKVFQDSTRFVFGEDDRTSKRMKYCSDSHDTNSFRDSDEDTKSATAKMHLFSGLCSEQHQRDDSNCRERMSGKSKLAENRDSGPIDFIDVSSDDDDCPSYSTIDLNLALGPIKMPPKETLASVSQFNSDRKGKLPNSSVDGKLDISDSASLALPLARTGNSFKTEILFLEEPEGGTSLSVFRGGT